MKSIIPVAAVLLVLFSCAGQPKTVQNETGNSLPEGTMNTAYEAYTGVWQGDIEAGEQKIKTVLHVKTGENGELKASVDSPEQGATGISASKVVATDKGLTVFIDVVKASYEAELTASGELKGTWHQGGASFPLNMKKLEAEPDYSKPQDPKQPYPYNSADVTFTNEKAGITLAGTLTYPFNGKADKAVVLITGSGPQNRNEELMGHRPFLVLSDYLTKKGIAVLRYDDRGVGESQGDPTAATSEDFADDAEAAVNYLKTQNMVGIEKIGLIGHSEGGMIAPMLAAKSKDIDFIVLMAGPGCTGEEVILQQSAAIMRAMGMADEAVNQTNALNRQIYDLVINSDNLEEASAQISKMLASYGMPKEQIDATASQIVSPWFKYFLSFDPAPVLEKVTVPVLAINGSLDLQVIAKENLPKIAAALERGGNKQYTVHEFEGLNHLFQPAVTGLVEEYPKIETTIAPEALDYIASWIGAL